MKDNYQKPDRVHNLNMKAVVRETGIKADTLRAWERRYGVPRPERSKGGHRLYSTRDVRILQWLKARQNEGLTIKLAVEEWRRLEESGGDPLQGSVYDIGSDTVAGQQTNLDGLRDQWVEACRSFNEARAQQVLSSAFAMFRPEDVSIQLLTSGLARIGEMWAEGELTVQQEHFASEIAQRRLEALIAAAPAPVRTGKVLILCPPGEHHAFIPLLITFLLRQSGRSVVYLGANVPAERLEESIRSLNPVLVVLCATLVHSAASALDLLAVLREEGVLGAFGGSVFSRFPNLIERIPAHYLGDDLHGVVERVESLILHRPVPPEPFHDQYLLEARRDYADRLVEIEQFVWEAMESTKQSYSSIAALNRFLSEQVLAALKLGQAGLPYSDRKHFLEYLQAYGHGSADLEYYLDVYIHAVAHVLGSDSPVGRSFQDLNVEEDGG